MVVFIGGGLKIKLLTSVTSEASTIVVPSSVRAGDLLLLLDHTLHSTTPANVVPTDFTQIATLLISTDRVTFSYKIADSNDEGDTLTGLNGSNSNDKLLAVLRPNRAITGVSVNDLDGVVTVSDPAAQTVTASSGTPPLLVIGAYACRDTVAEINPRTFTVDGVDAKDWEASHDGGTVELHLAGAFFTEAPPDVVVDMQDEGGNWLQSLYFELTF